MIKLSCPSCGAEVVFRAQSSVFAVCSFCKSTLVRQDMDLEKIGKMADLPSDVSPLQIGTVGYFEEHRFELVGRLRVAYSDGYWNEWFALFASDHEAWLAEAQGFYALCKPYIPDRNSMPKRETMRPTQFVELPPLGSFQIEDVREVRCIFSEGELPINAASGRESLSVDLTSEDNQMATIEFAKDETRIYTGKYLDFDAFKFQNLREIDGW